MHIYVWTYIVITFFILLNMFLAIIVDSYASVKADTEKAQGLVPEIIKVTHHGLRRIYKKDKDFISDQVLHGYLKAELLRLTSAETEAQDKQDAVQEILKSTKAVYMAGGVRVDLNDIATLLKQSGTNSAQSVPGIKWPQVAPETDIEFALTEATTGGGDAVFDLIERYGTDANTINDTRKEEMHELFQLENTRRILALHLGQAKMLHEARITNAVLKANMHIMPEIEPSILDLYDQGSADDNRDCVEEILQVTVVKATNLPKMVRVSMSVREVVVMTF